MSSSSPAILPISNPQSSLTTGVSAPSEAPIVTPALRAFINKLCISLRHGLSRRRPWAEFVHRAAFSKPDSLPEATLRIRKNYSYFRVNYLAIVVLVLILCLFSNPSSLFLLAAVLCSWIFLYLFRPADQPLVLFGRIFKDSEVLIGLVVFSVCVIFLTSVGSVLVSGLAAGMAIVCTHGALRSPDDLFLDEQEVNSTSFMGFFTGASSALASTPSN